MRVLYSFMGIKYADERYDESFMRVERVSWRWNSSILFQKYECVEN